MPSPTHPTPNPYPSSPPVPFSHPHPSQHYSPHHTPPHPNPHTRTLTHPNTTLNPSLHPTPLSHPHPIITPSHLRYKAIYNYKPQKSDELELHVNQLYIVTEHCKDGWYKGYNNKAKCGVFPGNYAKLFTLVIVVLFISPIVAKALFIVVIVAGALFLSNLSNLVCYLLKLELFGLA